MNNIKNNKNFLWVEKWVPVEINIEGVDKPPVYKVSNLGRLQSFQGNTNGKQIKGSVIQGYRSLNVRLPKGKSFNRYIHKLVAEHFVEKPSEEHKYVIHLDYDKQNNHFENLKWVTKEAMVEHNRYNPAVINRRIPKHTKNYKLTETKVRLIKRMLKSESTRLKMIAKQFGITHTQLNRIRSGENWSRVQIE